MIYAFSSRHALSPAHREEGVAPATPAQPTPHPPSPLVEKQGGRARCANAPASREQPVHLFPGTDDIAPRHGYKLAAENSKNMVIEGQQQQKTFLGRLANSSLNVKNLKEGLNEYRNRIHAKELLDGFTQGFR